jgi:hypothetical protein
VCVVWWAVRSVMIGLAREPWLAPSRNTCSIIKSSGRSVMLVPRALTKRPSLLSPSSSPLATYCTAWQQHDSSVVTGQPPVMAKRDGYVLCVSLGGARRGSKPRGGGEGCGRSGCGGDMPPRRAWSKGHESDGDRSGTGVRGLQGGAGGAAA